MTSPSEEALVEALSKVLLQDHEIEGLDEDLVAYISGLLSSSDEELNEETVEQLMGGFLDSVSCPPALAEQAKQSVLQLASDAAAQKKDGGSAGGAGGAVSVDDSFAARRLRQGIVSMASDLSHSTDADRYMWTGTESSKVNANVLIDAYHDKVSAKDKRKQRQELERARREYESKMRQEQELEAQQGSSAVSAMLLPDYRSGRNERDVNVRNVTLSLDNGRVLLENGELKFAYQRRYGLVGKNGIGKTTLLKAIAHWDIEGFPRHLRVLHVRQEITRAGDDTPVLQAVLDADVERTSLMQEESELLQRLEKFDGGAASAASKSSSDPTSAISVEEKRAKLLQQQQNAATAADASFSTDLKRLDEVYARLQVLRADAALSRAAMILSGLQFSPEMQAGPTSALSGGWRMRVALAAALFIEPELLLLDEPTNHLDLEAVLWLETYLVDYKHTVIIVSHDRGFLNEVCTDIIEFKNLKLTYYRGNFDTYVKLKEENERNTMRVYQAYQDKRQHMLEFIDKFRANAKRAAMVQSRIKALEKMDAEAPDPIEVETLWRFAIPNAEPLGRPIIAVDDVFFDYSSVLPDGTKKPESNYLLQKVNFGVDLTSRIAILGANGQGKTTLLNLIMGKLQPLAGSVTINGRLRIGYFAQHSADKFDLQLSAVENMLNLFDEANDQEMRTFLGKFEIQGNDALKPMLLLSGGQKSRVAFAALAYQKPHVLVVDEATNHLSMEAVDALVEAVQDFKGGLMVVSHDQYFVSKCCSELWVVSDGSATRFRGDFDDYKKVTAEKTRKRVEESVKRLASVNN